MSPTTRGRIRTLFAVPSAAVLVLSASQLLAATPAPSRAPNCDNFCFDQGIWCKANPNNYSCRYCGCT